MTIIDAYKRFISEIDAVCNEMNVSYKLLCIDGRFIGTQVSPVEAFEARKRIEEIEDKFMKLEIK